MRSLPAIYAKKSKIINIASVAAFLPQPNSAVYAASKSYVLSFSRALHQELKTRGITVTAVCPNPMETEFFIHSGGGNKVSKIKSIGVEKVQDVVTLALKKSLRKKDISIQHPAAKLIRLTAKTLPTHFIFAVEKLMGIF